MSTRQKPATKSSAPKPAAKTAVKAAAKKSANPEAAELDKKKPVTAAVAKKATAAAGKPIACKPSRRAYKLSTRYRAIASQSMKDKAMAKPKCMPAASKTASRKPSACTISATSKIPRSASSRVRPGIADTLPRQRVRHT